MWNARMLYSRPTLMSCSLLRLVFIVVQPPSEVSAPEAVELGVRSSGGQDDATEADVASGACDELLARSSGFGLEDLASGDTAGTGHGLRHEEATCLDGAGSGVVSDRE